MAAFAVLFPEPVQVFFETAMAFPELREHGACFPVVYAVVQFESVLVSLSPVMRRGSCGVAVPHYIPLPL